MAIDVRKIKKHIAHLHSKRTPFIEKARRLSNAIDPRRGQFEERDASGAEREQYDADIVNVTGRMAIRDASSGFYAGTVHPIRAWFNMVTVDEELSFVDAVGEYLFKTEKMIRDTLFASNFYEVVQGHLPELFQFGTMFITHEDDDDNVAHFRGHSFGSYYVENDDKGRPGLIILLKKDTVQNLERRFGRENLSESLQTFLQQGSYFQEVEYYQVFERNPDWDGEFGNLDADTRRYLVYSFEKTGREVNNNKTLEVSGLDEIPGYLVRWDTIGEDAYGSGHPGDVALGDIRQLQEMERTYAKALDRMASPLLQGPAQFRNLQNRTIDGLVIYDQNQNQQGLTPVYQVDPRVRELLESIKDVERRINRAFFLDLFRAISSMEGIQPRNELEIIERNQEAITLLGPVLQRFQNEFLVKVVERTFQQLEERDMLPEVPEELEGQPVSVKFVSSLARAQQNQEVNNILQLATVVGQMAQANPEAVDKFDTDRAIDKVALYTGTDHDIVRDQATVEKIRADRAEAARAAQQAQIEQQQAQANSQNAAAVKQITDVVSENG